LVVLKGGPAPENYSQSFPRQVSVAVNSKAAKLHLLSGVSGWGWPAVRDELPALVVTLHYADGEQERFTFVNGVHFADYVRPIEVPGSRYVEGITQGQQMRLLTIECGRTAVVERVVLESPEGNRTAPVVVAITADVEGRGPAMLRADKAPDLPAAGNMAAKGKGKGKAKGKGAAPLPLTGPKEGGDNDRPLAELQAPQWEEGKTRVLVIGGGSAHDFQQFFGKTDVETLRAAGFSVHYTEDRDQAAAELANADVAVISVNRKFFDTAAYRKALMQFAEAGKGIIMLHPGTWYGYQHWPELNAQIVGGGARGHDKIHPFDVIKKRDHPVMAEVPDSFTVEDELYYINAEPDQIPAGTAQITVLAETSPSDKYHQPHPCVWITQHPAARIVGIALGHDERTHDHPAFQKLMQNAVSWAAGK
jgi:type 1 glutamine amidotransferase